METNGTFSNVLLMCVSSKWTTDFASTRDLYRVRESRPAIPNGEGDQIRQPTGHNWPGAPSINLLRMN